MASTQPFSLCGMESGQLLNSYPPEMVLALRREVLGIAI